MKGTCHYCNKEFSKIGILRHIKSCTSIKKDVQGNEESLVDKFILSVSSKQNPKDEWMYIGVEKDAQLKDLEQFLKDMWMKCFEDVSVFKVNGQDCLNNMEIKFQDTVKSKDKIEIKFNTVCLEIKIVDEIVLTKKDNKVEILANTNEAELKDINQALKEASKDINQALKEASLEESVEAFRNDLVKDTKKENRKWSSIEKSFDLNYHLENLTKEELLTIAQNFAINKVASLKKPELKDKIIETYIEKANSFLLKMDSERFNFLVNLANNGHAYVEELNVELCVFSYFRDRGLIFTGTEENKHIIIMSDETKQIILSNNNEIFSQQLKRNEELIKLFWGMCYYYGVISLDNFKVLVKEYVDHSLDNIDLEAILKEASIYYGEFHFNGQIGSDVIVDDANYILSEQNKKESLDFHNFKKEELLEVAQINYNGKNEAYNELHRFLINRFSIKSDMAEALIFQLEDSIKNNKEFYNIVSNFLSNFDVNSREEANEIINELYKFANNTRQWVIKGYTAQEFTHMNRTIVKEPKVGRNDPCPCGSGKKYKKCCGKNK